MTQQFMQKRCIHLILVGKIKHFASLHYNNKSDSYLYVNGKEVIKFKTKYQSNVNGKYLGQMYLGNISSNFNPIDRKSTGLYGYVYDFSVSYDAIAGDDILDIHKYLMENNNIV